MNFQRQNSFETKYLPHLSSENFEWTLLNLTHEGLPKNTKNTPKIPMQFSVSILFSFHWENGSIINHFHTVAANSLKPSLCTCTHWEFSEDTKSAAWSLRVWEISARQNKTKQNKLPCFGDRYYVLHLCLWTNSCCAAEFASKCAVCSVVLQS